LIQIFPLDYKKIAHLLRNAKNIYFLEEGYRSGGVSEKIAAYLQDKNIKIHAIENFVDHGNLADLNHLCGFTAEKICQGIAPNPI
jgi:deoxyxylulose-5-phosphate synthase